MESLGALRGHPDSRVSNSQNCLPAKYFNFCCGCSDRIFLRCPGWPPPYPSAPSVAATAEASCKGGRLYTHRLCTLNRHPPSLDTHLHEGLVDQVLADDGGCSKTRVCDLGGCCAHRLHGVRPRETRRESLNLQ